MPAKKKTKEPTFPDVLGNGAEITLPAAGVAWQIPKITRVHDEVIYDLESDPNTFFTRAMLESYRRKMDEDMIRLIGIPNEFLATSLGQPWTFSDPGTPKKRELAFPGLTENRRVVLDLTFRGFGTSSQVVDPKGELLAIADPTSKYDPVPGAIVATVDLGIGLQKLSNAGARFDLIVCDLVPGGTCAPVGAFAPLPLPLATHGRRLILPGVRCVKPAICRLPLYKAIAHGVKALLSSGGEALLRMHVLDYNRLLKEIPTIGGNIWWTAIDGSYNVNVYVAGGGHNTGGIPHRREPSRIDRTVLHGYLQDWTKGQRAAFEAALLKQ